MLISFKEVDEPLLQVNLFVVGSVCKCADPFGYLDEHLRQWGFLFAFDTMEYSVC